MSGILERKTDVGSRYYPVRKALGVVTMNRPESRNALSSEMLARMYSPKLISLATPSGTIPPFADGISYAPKLNPDDVRVD